MIRHLTPADYKAMPWANGKGVTTELLRVEESGVLRYRLSRASVVEDGEFSLFPGIERNLTVITGPGFDLVGEGFLLPAHPFEPVAFAGDLPVRAERVSAPSDDFNVMTARALPRPEVAVITGAARLGGGGQLAIYALSATQVNGEHLSEHHMILTTDAVSLSGKALVVRLLDHG